MAANVDESAQYAALVADDDGGHVPRPARKERPRLGGVLGRACVLPGMPEDPLLLDAQDLRIRVSAPRQGVHAGNLDAGSI